MRLVISGIVQGVGFRPHVYRTAVSLGLNGKVWNDGADVIVDVDNAEAFISNILKDLPPLARVSQVLMNDEPMDKSVKGFHIVGSANGNGGISIPADTAVCGNCLNDMKAGRRKGYAFTSCTECGPRFTLIDAVPYDRKNTAMNEFDMCPECRREYSDPKDRRFHHQTVCCEKCGPKYSLTDANGKPIKGDPVNEFASILKNGGIGVMKSWGGMHICCTPENTAKLRKWYNRPQKPFALMVGNADTVKKYAEPNAFEMTHLTSVHRPIVLMPKVYSKTTEMIAPGLNTIGIFLPYTGMQHLLFDHLDAIVMTSANFPGEPMLLDNTNVMELNADAYLLHDQNIINRADDSVLRMNCGNTAFIRRSRGHVPSAVGIGTKDWRVALQSRIPVSNGIRTTGCVLGIGAQENLTASVLLNEEVHSTQHIGDGDSLGVPEYLETSVRSLTKSLKCTPQAVVMDKHPGYSNRPLGKMLAEEFGAELMEVQHHHAHAASLLADNNVEDAIVMTLDGTGYGDDGNAWGGEILFSDVRSYERLAHLQNIPLLGSEKALYDLRRLKFAVDLINGKNTELFNEKDSEVLRKLAPKSIKTSSFGRLLDTLAFTLGVCEKRTYDGEPAMKMESLLATGKMIGGFDTHMEGCEINTADLFARIGNGRKEDIAYSIIRNVVSAMTEAACDHAESKGTKNIGLTGGVSYSEPICRMFTEDVKKRGMNILLHNQIPNGDGGISAGQAVIGSVRL